MRTVYTIGRKVLEKGLSTKALFWILQAVVILVLIVLLNQKLSTGFNWFKFKMAFSSPIPLIVCLTFSFVNYGLEILRWKTHIEVLYKRSFLESSKDVLRGLGYGTWLPLGMGDHLAKVTAFGLKKTRDVIELNLLHGLVLTLSLFSFISYSYSENLFLTILFPILSFGLITKWHVLSILFSRIYKKTESTNWIFRPFRALIIIALSHARVGVFYIQYALLLYFIKPDLELLVFLKGISLLFFIKTVGQQFHSLVEFLGRNLAGIYYFENQGISSELFLGISTFIWLINIFFPIIFGLILSKIKE